MKILVALDGSDKDAPLLGAAAQLARKAGAELVLLNVVNPWADNPVTPTHTFAEGLERVLAERAAYLDRQRAALSELRFTTVVEQRRHREETDQCIARVAGEQQADMVAVASKRAFSLPGLILGSVALGVLRLSPCPVLVVRPE